MFLGWGGIGVMFELVKIEKHFQFFCRGNPKERIFFRREWLTNHGGHYDNFSINLLALSTI